MENNMPLISVVIPVFNVERYVQECINSVLAQTYKNLEIILVNDGSTDDSGLICEKYTKIDDRVRVIHKQNGGLSSARNAGIDQCHGEYISFIDSDDYVSPFFIQLLYESASDLGVDLISYSWYKPFLDGKDKSIRFDNKDHFLVREYSASEALKLMFYQKIPSGIPHRLYKKRLFESFRYPEGILFEEMATLYKIYITAQRNAVVYSEQYAYRLRSSGIVRRNFSEDKMIALSISKKIFSDTIDYDLGLKKAVASRMFSFLYQVFLQVPENDEANQKKLWNEIGKYRYIVMSDLSINVRIKNRIAALLTLLGMKNAHQIGRRINRL